MIQHLALIMDGNRRWAKKRALQPWLGHDEGTKTVREVVRFCLEHAIPYVSLYAFSLENFKRSPHEVSFLFDLFVREAESQLAELVSQGVRAQFIGDHALFPERVINSIKKLEQETNHNSTLTVNILFCYGSRQEIVHAAKKIAQLVCDGILKPEKITVDTIANNLWTAGIPEPELIIRTGGRKRLSNFLLYQAAYSELYFLDCLWPELRHEHLKQALAHFSDEQRNFGV